MSETQRMVPPLSMVLLAGFAIRPLPWQLLQPLLDRAMTAIHRRHPGIFERLAHLHEPLFLIDPVDMPFVFLLRPDAVRPSLRALRETDAAITDADATIRGPMMTLIDLLEGRIDGDALFFSRDLIIEGDTEAVVALRNAVDGAEIDIIGDVLSLTGPFAKPAQRVVNLAAGLFNRAAKDMETLRSATIAPAMRRQKAQSARLAKLEEKVNNLSRSRRQTHKTTDKT